MPDNNEYTDKIAMIHRIIPLLLKMEPNLIGLLYMRGYIASEAIYPNDGIEDIKLTKTGEDIIRHFETTSSLPDIVEIKEKFGVKLSDEDVQNYRSVFPSGSRGPGKDIVRHKLQMFMEKNNCTLQEIIESAKMYIQNNTLKGYNIIGAHYFLYKRDPDTKIDESKCEEYLELLRKNKPSEDYRNELV